jgi:hypothetical protein
MGRNANAGASTAMAGYNIVMGAGTATVTVVGSEEGGEKL